MRYLSIFLAFILFFISDHILKGGNVFSVSNPFEHKLFIESKGQFDTRDNSETPICYAILNEGMEIYFTKEGIIYRHNIFVEDKENLEVDKDLTLTPLFSDMKWIGSNPNVKVEALGILPYYFTFQDPNDASGKTGIKTSAYEKIIYHDIYPNIDIEYSFPKNKSKGFKYNIILKPGSDPSQIKMKYDSNITLDSDGNVLVSASFGDITDHHPLSFYADDKANEIASSFFRSDQNVLSFQLENYDKSKTIIIDPWTTTPTFSSGNKAYDINRDQQGNTYIYGGDSPYELIKLNSLGAISWIYVSTPFGFGYYGDFAVDAITQNAYMCPGFHFGGTTVVKVNSSGIQTAAFIQTGGFGGATFMNEYWRMEYNQCTNQTVIAGGGTIDTLHAILLDTNLTTLTPVNVLSATGPLHDMALLTQDNYGNCYMLSARSVVDPTFEDNTLLRLPLPSLVPADYKVYSGHTFVEVGSVKYYDGATSNGFNGMAASKKYVYTYDGALVKKWDALSGALTNSVTVSQALFSAGGMAVDECDNLFVGVGKEVQQYDSTLSLVNTIILPDSIYDLVIDNTHIYTCGLNFVSVFDKEESQCDKLILSFDSSAYCSEQGYATANVLGGFAPYSFLWNTDPVQTTQTINVDHAGSYTVTVTDQSCYPITAIGDVTVPLVAIKYSLDSLVNVFTPNDDQVNDVFRPFVIKKYSLDELTDYIDSYSLKIYNRWGNKVYDGYQIKQGWDGKHYKGNFPLEDGTYFWIAEIVDKCTLGNEKVTKGFVHLYK